MKTTTNEFKKSNLAQAILSTRTVAFSLTLALLISSLVQTTLHAAATVNQTIPAAPAPSSSDSTVEQRAEFGRLPLIFEENRGQADAANQSECSRSERRHQRLLGYRRGSARSGRLGWRR